MFSVMKRRSLRRICLPLVLGLFVVLAVTSFVVVRFYWATFTDSTDNAVGQQERNVRLYMNLMAETARQFTKLTETQEENTPQYEDMLSARLLSLIQRDESILGAAYILSDGRALASQYVTGYPSMDSLRRVPSIADFISSGEEERWIVRTEQLAAVYDKHPYDAARGMLTYLARVRVNEEDRGYLLIDVNPQYIVEYFSDIGGASSEAAVYQEGNGFLLQPGLFAEAGFTEMVMKESKPVSSLSGRRIYRMPFCGEHTIVVAISTDGVTGQIVSFLVPMALLFLLLAAVSILVSHMLTRSISEPLERLYTMMNDERLEPVIGERPEAGKDGEAAPPPSSHNASGG